MRVVLDTNIWIAGLLWRGKPWQLLRFAEKQQIQLCISHQMLLELAEVLGYSQFQQRLHNLNLNANELTAFALSISLPVDVSREPIPIVDADPDDDIFLLCAVAAQAVYVVSNDHHLLNMKNYKGIKIVRIDDFLKEEFGIE